MTKLQSQKYRTCIDACNETIEASELCALKCLHDENVKSLAKCVEICLHFPISALLHHWQCLQKVNIQKKFVICVPRYVMPMILNVKNIVSIWNIAGYV